MAEALVARIRALLEPHIEPAYRDKMQHFHKETITGMGVRTSQVRAIAKELYPEFRKLPVDDFLDQCEALLQAGIVELTTVGLAWADRHVKKLEARHFDRLYDWLQRYVHNWADCDHLCTRAFGYFLITHPEFIPTVKSWTGSDNRWIRRAAAVILIPELRKKGSFLPHLFEISTALLPDEDDLVQKGYGWALKAATKHHAQSVFDYVCAHRADMPRTALRYAIEKLPDDWKAEAMRKV